MSLRKYTKTWHYINGQHRFLVSSVILAVCFISGCVFVPTATEDQDQIKAKCELSTHSYKLTEKQMNYSGDGPDLSGINNDNADEALEVFVALGIAIPVGSFVVSGSIVAAGNTLHWIEYQGKCSDGLIAKLEKKMHWDEKSHEDDDSH